MVRPETTNEVYDAIKLTNSLGCKNFHLRPASSAWFTEKQKLFSKNDIGVVSEQLKNGRKDFPNMNIIGVFDKVGDEWEINHPFQKCWASLCTFVVLSSRKFCLCCDLRGYEKIEVGPFEDPNEFFEDFWGSKKHFEIMKNIVPNRDCGKCTLSMLNVVFEQAVIEDNFMLSFL